MATKSQRKKDLRKKKRQQKKGQQRNRRATLQSTSSAAAGSSSRQRRRLARQTPQAWEGEPLEDVALFEDSALESLPPELTGQAFAVREALRCACASLGDEALKHISAIPRSSPLSEWRLFVRGLVQWMANDTDAADEAWRRLNPQRRAGRIAVAMMVALRSDLENVSAQTADGETSGEAASGWLDRLDDQLLYHARLLRRIRFDRTAIRIAESGVRISADSRKLQLGPNQIRWLKNFAAEYRETEPELVAALDKTALHRAFEQNYSDLFDTAVRAFAGPRHDCNNRLLTFFYYMQFRDDPSAKRRAERNLKEYLTNDLPRNEELSEPLRGAIASQIHLQEAIVKIEPPGGGMFDFMFSRRDDSKAIRQHLEEAARAFPANRRAYEEHARWLESKLENDRLTKPERQPLIGELAQVMQSWSRGLPDDVEPRLWLVDHLLENEHLEQSRPHVDWLAASRQDDPRVRAVPWKWQLLEAMRLCRRKAWLAEVPARLDEAESKWPSWLSQKWLTYLKAAWSLRSGKTGEFEQQRQRICNEANVARDSLADACMMLGAAQRMRVPAADLKPLRAPVDAAVKNIGQLPLDELIDASSFFWDLQRTQLLYPAYRMHGSKLVKQTFARLSAQPKFVVNRIEDGQVQAAVLLSSEHRFCSDSYELKLPSWYSNPAVAKHPLFVAAKVNAFLKLRSHWRNDGYAEAGSLLREAAQAERDPYYRYWFASLADELDDLLAREASRPFGFGFGAFSRMFGFGDDDDDDDEDGYDGDLGFDPDCDCPQCRAAKRAYEASR